MLSGSPQITSELNRFDGDPASPNWDRVPSTVLQGRYTPERVGGAAGCQSATILAHDLHLSPAARFVMLLNNSDRSHAASAPGALAGRAEGCH
jgi:hypothetical protein